MVLGRIIEQVSVECHMQNDNSACLYFLIVSPNSYFHFISGLYISNHVKYFNDTWKDYVTGQYRVYHARMKTLLFSVISHDPYFSASLRSKGELMRHPR